MTSPTVFISYSHDSDEHSEQVLSLSERLRLDGFTTQLDQYVNGTPTEGWPRWMLNQLDTADFVLVVCTETYYRRFRGHENPGKGKGVDWEGALITQELYDSHSKTLKFIPVLLSGAEPGCIPEPLRASTHYALASESVYQELHDFLLDQAGVKPGPVGTPNRKPRRQGKPLTFVPNTEQPHPPDPSRYDIARILKYAPSDLIGRKAESAQLDEAWTKAQNGETGRPRILTFVALGGEGKTSLAAKWTVGMADRNWPGCEAAFAWSFTARVRKTRQQPPPTFSSTKPCVFLATKTLPPAMPAPTKKANAWPALLAGSGPCSFSTASSLCSTRPGRL